MGQTASEHRKLENKPQPKQTLRVSLLGTGESGKSTVAKNMLNMTQSSSRLEFPGVLPSNVRTILLYGISNCIHQLVMKADFPWKEGPSSYDIIKQFIEAFHKDHNLQSTFNNRHLLQFPIENFVQLISKIDDINELKIGKVEDLESYIKTCGIAELTAPYSVFPTKLVVVDTEGQRCGRKKWKFTYEKTDVVFYVVSLSEFNQVCYEDEETNRFDEAMEAFTSTLSDPNFPHTKPLHIIFNKVDVLKNKLDRGFDMTSKFPEMTDLMRVFRPNVKKNQCRESNETVQISVSSLGNDELGSIFKFLEPIELWNCMQCSHQLFELANMDMVWFELCKIHHPSLCYKHALDCYQKYECKVVDENNSIYKYYYLNKGWVVEKSIDFIKGCFVQNVPQNVNLKSVHVLSAVNPKETERELMSILSEKLI